MITQPPFDISLLPEQAEQFRLKRMGESIAYDAVAETTADESNMSAVAIISTPTPDRVRDSLNPRGCRLENYKRNPVVLWEHGLQFSLPLGTSEAPDGSLAVSLGARAVVATCFFTNKVLMAEQIFELVKDRIIRATSVRAMPLAVNVVQQDGENSIYRMDEWDLEEWSWCAVGMNPEAVAACLSKNRLAGRPLVESLVKSLKPLAPPRKATARGWSKTAEPMPEDDAETTAANARADDTAGETSDDEPVPEQYGAKYLAALHGGLADLMSSAIAGRRALENKNVADAVDEATGLVERAIARLAACHKSEYGIDLSWDGVAEQKSLVKFLGNGGPRHPLAGAGHILRKVSAAPNVTPEQRRDLHLAMKTLAGIIDQAKSAPKATAASAPVQRPSAEMTAAAVVIKQITTEMGAMAKALDNIIPHNLKARR